MKLQYRRESNKNFIDKNEDEVYGYRMTFVPSYEGIAAHDVAHLAV